MSEPREWPNADPAYSDQYWSPPYYPPPTEPIPPYWQPGMGYPPGSAPPPPPPPPKSPRWLWIAAGAAVVLVAALVVALVVVSNTSRETTVVAPPTAPTTAAGAPLPTLPPLRGRAAAAGAAHRWAAGILLPLARGGDRGSQRALDQVLLSSASLVPRCQRHRPLPARSLTGSGGEV